MKRTPTVLLALISLSGLALAQEPPSGWRRVGDPPPASAPAAQTPAQPNAPAADAQDPSQPVAPPNDAYGQPQQTAPPANRPAYGLPPQLTLKPGTYVSVRINQYLTTDRNHVGDTFSASLMAPIVVDGVVIANRGQIAYGRVAEVEKHHSDKPSRLGLELTGLTLADGTQAPVGSQLVAQQGRSTPGAVQAGTIVGTTAVGAAVGGIAGYGTGAAIGAGAGAVAGVIGVLLTRNHATVVYPETPLTFQLTSPVTISTANASAFRFAGPEDYGRSYSSYTRPGAPPARPGPQPYYYAPSPYYYPGYYAPYPYYWGPSVWIGGGWGFGGWYGRRWR